MATLRVSIPNITRAARSPMDLYRLDSRHKNAGKLDGPEGHRPWILGPRKLTRSELAALPALRIKGHLKLVASDKCSDTR